MGNRDEMPGIDRSKIVVLIVLIALAGCMEPGDRGLGPACESTLSAAERELRAAKSNSIGRAIDWAKAVTLIAAARTQQQFNEYQNCLIKARSAREILAQRK
jgi:hypothetical protein